MPLYHRCRHLHQPGALIQPGNWGKIVTGWGPRHGQYLREYAFERIRDREFSDKPSRVACVFAFEDDAFAKAWTRGNPPEPEHVYLIDTVEPDTPTLRVDMAWIDVFWQYHSFDSIDECIRHYWRGDATAQPKWEVLVAGPVVVRQRASQILDDQLNPVPE
jgi:hypothetical protein